MEEDSVGSQGPQWDVVLEKGRGGGGKEEEDMVMMMTELLMSVLTFWRNMLPPSSG
jgi:hypothetical protein